MYYQEKESSNDRMIEWRILKTWERLKIIRKSQSFSSTKSRIVVRRQDTDIDAGQSLRERYIATYMNELQELFDIEKEVNESSVTSENSPIIPEPSEPMLIKSDDNHQQERRTNFSRRKRGKTSSVVFDDSATFDREITRQWIEKVSGARNSNSHLFMMIERRNIFPAAWLPSSENYFN